MLESFYLTIVSPWPASSCLGHLDSVLQPAGSSRLHDLLDFEQKEPSSNDIRVNRNAVRRVDVHVRFRYSATITLLTIKERYREGNGR